MELQIKEEFKKHIPPLTVEEFKQLEENCIAEGIRDAIITWQGFIIDGHNRYEIAQKHGLRYQVEENEFEGEDKVELWMIDNQSGRRNLTDGWKYKLQQRKKEILLKKGKEEKSKAGGDKKSLLSNIDKSDFKTNNERHNTQKEIAKALDWSTGKVAMADVVFKKATPELEEKVLNNEITINQAYQEIKKEEKKAERIEVIQKQIEDIESGILPELKGLYDVVSIDPPWPYEGNNKSITSFDAVGRRVANPYPEMSIQEIKEIELPLMNDAVVLLWTTHKFLPDAFDILKTWGLEYKATLVWNKEKIGMGAWLRMQCEFCLIGIKGKPYWNNTEHRDILNEPRREHSRKPDKFFELIEKITLGRRLEYFSREKRTGWEVYGNDINKF
jgi:N6-adenosine-specific RNA methylase IME4/predicted double-glycine peptidase